MDSSKPRRRPSDIHPTLLRRDSSIYPRLSTRILAELHDERIAYRGATHTSVPVETLHQWQAQALALETALEVALKNQR